MPISDQKELLSLLFIHCYSFIVMCNKWAPVICCLVHDRVKEVIVLASVI